MFFVVVELKESVIFETHNGKLFICTKIINICRRIQRETQCKYNFHGWRRWHELSWNPYYSHTYTHISWNRSVLCLYNVRWSNKAINTFYIDIILISLNWVLYTFASQRALTSLKVQKISISEERFFKSHSIEKNAKKMNQF